MTDARDNLERTTNIFLREHWRDTVAALTREFGTARLEDIENVVQGALLKACEQWSYKGIPQNPPGWIYRVARNGLLDQLRREKTRFKYDPDVREIFYATTSTPERLDLDVSDDVLKMIFVCTHPDIGARDSVVLTLRIICGFGFNEISKALLLSEASIKKSLTRCKHRIVTQNISLEFPSRSKAASRIGRILTAIYLIFNEGYLATDGDTLYRTELCYEAERLLDILRQSRFQNDTRIWALSALVAFQSSRLKARLSDTGTVQLLGRQDRNLWSKALITRGFDYLQTASQGEIMSPYHIEAAIAACHVSAPSYDETDWGRIISYYDALLNLKPSPIVRLNRAVAIMEGEGAETALPLLEALLDVPLLKTTALLPSVLGTCYSRLSETTKAKAQFKEAARRSDNQILSDHWTSKC